MRATIVYGFLGAGKTTLLRSLVPRLASVESTALLVNEFGIEGVDQVVLASDDLTVRQLAGGCVCCEVRGDLMVALDEIERVVGPDRLVIEPTGLASPDTLAHVFASPSVRSIVLVDSIITVLDATRYALVRDHLGEFFPNQVRHADLVLVNKSDAASEAERRDARAWARSLNPGAAIVDTMYCNVDSDLLLAAVRQGRVRRAEPGDDVDLNVKVPHDDLAASGLERLVLDTGALPAERVDTFVRDLAAGERTLVCVFREGMWITSHAPQLQNTHFANLAPFCAVVNVEDPSAGSDENSICALVREAEGETHSQIRPSEITDPDKKKSLEEALKRIADVLRAEGKPSVGQVVEPDQLRIFRGRLLTPAPAPPVRRQETDDPPEDVTDTDTDDDDNGGGAGHLAGALIVAIIAPFIAMLIQMAVSRQRELKADDTGSRRCGDPEALAYALMKLEQGVRTPESRYAAEEMKTAEAANHMFIVNPLAGGAGKFFSTHPPTEQRVERLRKIGEEIGRPF